MSIKEPTDLAKKATVVLDLCRGEPSLQGLDHTEMATMLRTAANVYAEMAAHNLTMMNIANILAGSVGPK